MRYTPDQKKLTHERMLGAAGESFRKHGYGGIGVDGLAKAAGVTSGAFYKHFSSKSAAFAEVIKAGLSEVVAGVGQFREAHGKNWWKAFADFYVGERRLNELNNSCSLQSLSGEAMRGDEQVRVNFEASLMEIVEATGDDFETAIANLSLLIGGVTLARAVQDPALADRIAKAVGGKF